MSGISGILSSYSEKRRKDVPQSVPVIAHDHDMSSYYSCRLDHRKCLAHVLWYIVCAIGNKQDLTCHKRMHDLLQDMIHMIKENPDSITRSEVCRFTDRYEAIL